MSSLPLCGPTPRSSDESENVGGDDRSHDAGELVLPRHAGAEGQRLEDIAGVVVEGGDGGARERERGSDARDALVDEEVTQRLRDRDGEAGRGLVVVVERGGLRRGEVRGLRAGSAVSLGGVVVVFRGEELETERDGLVAEVRLVEPQAEVAREIADIGLHGEGLAQAEEVVGLVGKADEGAGETGDSAVETDGVLAFLLQLQQQVDGAFVGVLAGFGVLFGLERFKVIELVQTQQREIPKARVVDLTFFEQEFAADDFVAGDRVAGELDARDIEGLAFFDVDIEIDEVFGFVEARNGRADEVDVAKLAVGLLQLLHALLEDGGVEVFTVLVGELSAQDADVPDGFVAFEGDAPKPVASAFLHRHQQVDALADGGVQDERVEAGGVADVGLGLFGERLEVPAVAIGLANALGVFVQLGGVEGAGEDVFQEDGVGDADRLEVLHRGAQGAIGNALVAVEDDLAHLDGRAFLDVEGDGNGGRRNGLDLGLDDGELVSVFTEQRFEDGLGALDAGRVILTFDRQPDFFLLEALLDV